MEEFIMPKEIDINIRYIICPDINCIGFTERFDWCTETEYGVKLSKEIHNIDTKICPHIDKAKLVVFCGWGHPIEDVVNVSTWRRANCSYPDCYSMTFTRMATRTMRIPLGRYEEFLKLPIKKH